MQNNKLVWDKIFSKKNWGQYPAEDLIRFIKINFKKSKLNSKKKLLEIGCATGGNLAFFCKEGFEICGIDSSKIAIKAAKKKLNKEYPNWKGELIVANIEKYNFKKNSYDIIIDSEVSCCLPLNETIELYKNLSRSLRKNGKIFLRTFSTKCSGYKSGKKVGYNRYLPKVALIGMGAQRFASSTDIDNILKNNFKILKKEMLTRTINNRKNQISEWIVEAKKINI